MMTGTIRDVNTRAGLWLAHVVAFELDGTFIVGAVSDQVGRYELTVPGVDREILVRVSYVGYVDSSALVASGISWYDVDLTPATYELPEVEIFPDAPAVSAGGAGLGVLALLLLLGLSSES